MDLALTRRFCNLTGRRRGGIGFMRPWAEKVYGVPPEQGVGTSIKTKFELRDGKPVLVRLSELNFIDDGAGKPVGIQMHRGKDMLTIIS